VSGRRPREGRLDDLVRDAVDPPRHR
jgi:hypothetical protein